MPAALRPSRRAHLAHEQRHDDARARHVEVDQHLARARHHLGVAPEQETRAHGRLVGPGHGDLGTDDGRLEALDAEPGEVIEEARRVPELRTEDRPHLAAGPEEGAPSRLVLGPGTGKRSDDEERAEPGAAHGQPRRSITSSVRSGGASASCFSLLIVPISATKS